MNISTLRSTVVLATLLAMFTGACDDGPDPYVLQLEQQVQAYSDQVDSLLAVSDSFEGRINAIRSQLDTARASNILLVSSLQKVTRELKSSRVLYSEQIKLNGQLRAEVAQLRQERDRSVQTARQLSARVRTLDEELLVQRNRMERLEASLKESSTRATKAEAAVGAAYVFAGTREQLEKDGKLKVKQTTAFTDRYTVVDFPKPKDFGVVQMKIGKPLTISGEVRFLVDRHGKLKEGQAYTKTVRGGQTEITLLEETLQGARLLAVTKR